MEVLDADEAEMKEKLDEDFIEEGEDFENEPVEMLDAEPTEEDLRAEEERLREEEI